MSRRILGQMIVGAIATAATAGSTYAVTKFVERRSMLRTAKELKALGCCPMCQKKLEFVIEHDGRTHKPGI